MWSSWATRGADGLVNVAGIIQPFVRLGDLEFDVIDRVLDVNLYGTLHTVKAFLPHLRQRPVAHVANVSSMGGFQPVPGGAAADGESRFPMTDPDVAARTIVDGIEANRLHVYVGRDARLMNLLTRIAPRRSIHLIRRQMRSLLGT